MSLPLSELRRLTATALTTTASTPADASSTLALRELAGRLCELSSAANGAALTVAFRLVLDAQAAAEPVAWVTPVDASFFPPDAADGGVDLAALIVVRAPDRDAVARVADPLLRSGAFGLVVLDIGAVRPPLPLQSRLLGLAQKHDTAVVFLTEAEPLSGSREAASLGSLISWRAVATRTRCADGNAPDHFVCTVEVSKDKRRGPGSHYEEVCCGPPGLR